MIRQEQVILKVDDVVVPMVFRIDIQSDTRDSHPLQIDYVTIENRKHIFHDAMLSKMSMDVSGNLVIEAVTK